MWKRLIKEITPFMELGAAIILSFIIVLGTIHNLIKPFYDYRKRKFFWDRLKAVGMWYVDMMIQFWLSVYYLLKQIILSYKYIIKLRFWGAIKHIVHEIARTLDLIGNVAAGEMIEDIITPIEKTYFGFGEITISAAVGYIEHLAIQDEKAINGWGRWLINALNVAFNEPFHSLDSYKREIKNHPIYGETWFLDRVL